MENKQIRELTTKELQEAIKEQNLNLTRMRLSHAVSPIENPMKMREAKKLIARLHTEFNKRVSATNKV